MTCPCNLTISIYIKYVFQEKRFIFQSMIMDVIFFFFLINVKYYIYVLFLFDWTDVIVSSIFILFLIKIDLKINKYYHINSIKYEANDIVVRIIFPSKKGFIWINNPAQYLVTLEVQANPILVSISFFVFGSVFRK